MVFDSESILSLIVRQAIIIEVYFKLILRLNLLLIFKTILQVLLLIHLLKVCIDLAGMVVDCRIFVNIWMTVISIHILDSLLLRLKHLSIFIQDFKIIVLLLLDILSVRVHINTLLPWLALFLKKIKSRS